jgi:hypothetical protein
LFFYLDWFPVEPRQGLPQPRDPPAVPVRRKLCGHVRCEPPVHTNAPIYVDDPQQPYIAKHIFQTQNPPVKLRKITVGDGSLGSQATVEHLPVVSASIQLLHNTDENHQLNVIETYPVLIGYDEQVFEYFREQCVLNCAAAHSDTSTRM